MGKVVTAIKKTAQDVYDTVVDIIQDATTEGYKKDGYIQLHISTNVVKDYPWGIHSREQLCLSEVPTIRLTEFQPQNGPMQEMLMYGSGLGKAGIELVGTSIGNMAAEVVDAEGAQNKIKAFARSAKLATDREHAYNKMYTATPTGNVYTFPFFSTYNHSITNEWKEADALGSTLIKALGGGGAAESAGSWAKNIASAASNAYVSVTKRQEYAGIAGADFETTFQLFNTLSDYPMQTITDNFKLLYALQHNNMPDKLSYATMMPPVLYQMEIPGIRYSPAVYIKNLVVENIGQVNQHEITAFGNTFLANIPDAWSVQMTFSEMLPESRNLFKQVLLNEKTIRVIEE
jgi:hypothetical protein